MHDTVCPHYTDMLLNIEKGHSFLLKEFGVRPRAAWSLEPYGHSEMNARLWAESGIEAMFVKEMDPEDRENRIKNQSMEFIWRPNYWNVGKKAELFTHVIYDFHVSPFDLVLDKKDPRPKPDDNKPSKPLDPKDPSDDPKD